MGRVTGRASGFAIENVLASLKGQLSLDTSQQVMWDNAVAQAQGGARDRTREHGEGARSAERRTRQGPSRTLRPLATVGDAAQASNQALRKQVRDQWLKLYATFTPAQKAVVRDAVKARVAGWSRCGRSSRSACSRARRAPAADRSGNGWSAQDRLPPSGGSFFVRRPARTCLSRLRVERWAQAQPYRWVSYSGVIKPSIWNACTLDARPTSEFLGTTCAKMTRRSGKTAPPKCHEDAR